MIEVDGKSYPTIRDVIKRFNVTSKQVYEWIRNGVIPKPPSVQKGRKRVKIFPEDYMKVALRVLKEAGR